MPADPLALEATPRRVLAVAHAARLSDEARDRALDFSVGTPSPSEWRRFLSVALILLGVGLLLAGAICFVAYNWDRFGRFAKFAMIEMAIVGAALVAWRKLPRISGQVALLAAAVLVGPLLALFGQTYQTGADPYGLFLTWFALIIPWVIASRFSALWVLAIVLLDVSIVLYAAQVLGLDSAREFLYVPLAIAALHMAAVVCWEWQADRPQPWLDERWAVRVVAVLGFVALLVVGIVVVFVDTKAGAPGVFGMIVFGAALAVALQYYRSERPDQFMVTLAVTVGLAWLTALVGRFVMEMDLGPFGLFVMAAVVIAEITLGVKWYRRHAS
jgi:uncharacterized membrane protein